MKKKIIISSVAVFTVAGAAVLFFGSSRSSKENELPKVKVERGTIIDKALAVGTIEPEYEISVKSKVSGVVKKIYADAGTYVHAGDPLMEVKPDPAPIELADAERQVQLADVEMDNLTKEKVRQESLMKKALISEKDYDNFQSSYENADLRRKIAKEKLELLQSGKVRIEGKDIESVIRAPIDGFVLKKMVEEGDPVVPIASFSEGTVLMKMANMERLIFKGTVDEIDVGKLREGMDAELKVGALPNDTVHGTLRQIWLKAEKKENATVFPIEILIPKTPSVTLRAGYSANASIIIQKKTNVLTIPERVVTIKPDSTSVMMAMKVKDEMRLIKTGLSDAISVEVLSGLKEGDEVREKPVKKID